MTLFLEKNQQSANVAIALSGCLNIDNETYDIAPYDTRVSRRCSKNLIIFRSTCTILKLAVYLPCKGAAVYQFLFWINEY